jgi:hypothetical protein
LPDAASKSFEGHRFMPYPLRLRSSIVVGVWLLTALVASAQDKAPRPPGNEDDGLPKEGFAEKGLPAVGPNDQFGFQHTWEGVRLCAALQMIAAANPVGVVGVRLAAAENPLTWPDWELTLERPLPLSANLLDAIKDSTPVPSLTMRPLSDLKPDERAFYLLTCQALIYSHLVKAELFEKVGEDDDHGFITFAHLWRQPKLYRGEIVPVRGRMIRLRRWEAPKLAQENGVKYFWEGWVVGPTRGVNPYCIIFSELPEGLKEAEKMDRPVRFYGYYIKKFRYDAEDAKRETHILIGPTVFLEKAPGAPPPTGIFSRDVLILTGVGFFSITAIIAGLTFWFRRGDRAVHSKLATLRDGPLELGSSETDPPPVEPREPDPDFGPHGRRDGT